MACAQRLRLPTPRVTPTLSLSSRTMRSAVFLPDSADARESRRILIDHRFLESGYAHSAQHREREFRPNARDVIHQQPEQVAFRRGHKTVKDVRILANLKMCENLDRFAGLRQFVETR